METLQRPEGPSHRANVPSRTAKLSELFASGETREFPISALMCRSPFLKSDSHVKALESRSQLLDSALASADEANRRWEECRALVDQLRIENAALRQALSQAQLQRPYRPPSSDHQTLPPSSLPDSRLHQRRISRRIKKRMRRSLSYICHVYSRTVYHHLQIRIGFSIDLTTCSSFRHHGKETPTAKRSCEWLVQSFVAHSKRLST
jgi:hypothetical protein